MTLLVTEVTIGDLFLTQQNDPQNQGKLPQELVLPLEISPDKEKEYFQKKSHQGCFELITDFVYLCEKRSGQFLKKLWWI